EHRRVEAEDRKEALNAPRDLRGLRAELLCGPVDPAESGTEEADPERHRQRPADDAEDDPELIPRHAGLLDQRHPEAEDEEEGGRVDAGADPGAHPPERGEGGAVLLLLED